MLERVMTCKKFVRQFQILQKKKLKNSDIKTFERPKILKNKIIDCLGIIETKQSIYD